MRTVIFYIIFIFLISCTVTNNGVLHLLNKAEQQMEQYPDSSLNTLNDIHPSMLDSRADKARYALLKSMALDKNYIDVTSDSLTSVAIAYYKKHGTPDDKMKAYYYNGKVYGYAGDYETAMSNYIQSEQYVLECKDYIAVGRLYNAKMMVYKKIFNLDDAVLPAELSAEYYLLAKDTSRYITALNSLSAILLAANEYGKLESCLDEVAKYEKKMTLSHKNTYYINTINYKISTLDSSLKVTVDEYMKQFHNTKKQIKWLELARAYNVLGDYENALVALKEYKVYNKQPENLYYYFASEIYRALGDYTKAYENLQLYQTTSSKRDYKLLQSDTKFLEERYMSQKKAMEQKYLIVVLILTVITIVSISLYLYSYFREINRRRMLKVQELEEQKLMLQNEYEKALAQQKKLQALISDRAMAKNVRNVLEQRLEILNKFIVSDISGVDMSKSLEELKRYLSNNEEFLNSTTLSFKVTHPKFISFLSKKGLNDWEIGCCCLYCLGLNGNEISNYLNIKYFHKKFSSVRRKLNIQSINTDTYLMNKLKEL